MTNLAKPNAMSQAVFGALTADQIQQIPIASLASLDQTHYQYLTGTQIAAMSAEQIGALKHPDWLSPSAMAGMTAPQVAAIAPAAWSKVSSACLNALSPGVFSAIPPTAIAKLAAAAVRGLSDADFQAMTAAQFAAIADNDWIPLSAVAKLRPDQVQTTTDWDSTSARWLNALSPEAFAAIPAAGINQMSLAALQGLDATRRAIALKGADELHAGYIDMASKDATVNYDSALANLQLMCSNIGSGGLTSAQFDAFNNTLASAKGAAGNPTYVSSLMGSMGVQVNMSADAFNQAVCKWFLGTDTATAKGYTDVSDKALFNGAIQQAAVGVAQGQLGDCWLISSLEELAVTAPERLNGLISANGNGTYAVKFYNGSADKPVFVTVDGKVANYGADTSAGAWARLVEDAFVEACASGLLQAVGYSNWTNDTDRLNGGWAYRAMTVLTGGATRSYQSGATGWDAVQAALADGAGMVTYASYGKSSTGGDGKTNLVGSHAFAVIGIDEANHKYIFRNPWGSDFVFELSPQELDAITGNGEFFVMSSPAEYGSATAHFSATDWSTVSADWINAQPAAMIAAITPTALSHLCGTTVNGLSAATVQIMSTQQLLALPHLDQLSASAVKGLVAAQFKALTAGWYNGLSAEAFAAIPATGINQMTKASLQGLDAIHRDIALRSADATHAGYIQTAPAATTDWSQVTASGMNALSTPGLAAIAPADLQKLSASTVQGLGAATVASFSPQQIAGIPNIEQLSVAAFGALTAAQVPAIAASWTLMSADRLNALSAQAFAAIPAAGINQMTKESLQGLDVAHHDLALKLADPAHAAILNPVPPVSPVSPASPVPPDTPKDWSRMTAADLNALSPAALAAVKPADLARLPAATVHGLSADTIRAMNGKQVSHLPAIQTLSSGAVAALRPHQALKIAATANWSKVDAKWLNALSSDAFAGLPASAINHLSSGSLQGLDAAHRAIALKRADAKHAGYLTPAATPASTSSAAPLVQALASFNAPPAMTTPSHANAGAHAPFTLVTAH